MLVEDIEDPHYNGLVLLLCLATEDEDVVHVDDYNPFVYELSEDVIHHHLECCQAVSETCHDLISLFYYFPLFSILISSF